MADKTQWATAVVKVGAGRGFVVGNRRERFVVTAGHCLPELPPYHAASYTEERTYGALLGPIDGDQIVCAECLFADPIADIAVLGTPDGQELYDEAQAYEARVGGATPVPIAELTLVRPPITLSTGATMFGRPMAKSEGWMLSLDGRWFRCDVTATSRSLWIANAAEAIEGGMSGSPIVDEVGKALGVVCISAEPKAAEGREMGEPREGGPNPLLTACLPGWLLSELSKADEDE